jgi:hypothetical protein
MMNSDLFWKRQIMLWKRQTMLWKRQIMLWERQIIGKGVYIAAHV